jgi:inositol 1,4,5-triphosphate receptor type 1
MVACVIIKPVDGIFSVYIQFVVNYDNLLLVQTFIGNQITCLKILPQQIQNIVDLAAAHQEKAPEFLDLLNVIVKVEGLGLTLKRNQAYVMKYIMQDYNKLAYVLDQPREFRERILTMKSGTDHLKYLINLVDLLATCAEVT